MRDEYGHTLSRGQRGDYDGVMRAQVAETVLHAIGRTPVVRLKRLPDPGSADVFVKLEDFYLTGSYKDCMALAMIEGAERRGHLRPGRRVVEYTGGSTGSSLAMICAVKGHPLMLLSSDASRRRSSTRCEPSARRSRCFRARVER